VTLFEILGLGAAAAVAGAINAVAGGGTVVTFPVLIFFGLPTIVANATSTVALVIGTAGSLYGFRSYFDAIKPWLVRFVPVSILGGWLGGVLLTRTPETIFAKLVPFLILFATILFLAQNLFRRFSQASRAHAQSKDQRAPAGTIGAMIFQFFIAVYGGYFGAGIGILMLASLGFLGLDDIHEMNALKNVLGSLINLVAAAWFIANGLVRWPVVIVMSIGAILGYFLAAHYSQRISQDGVRRLVTTVGLSISAYMFYRQFFA
jgi:hypothetical protein